MVVLGICFLIFLILFEYVLRRDLFSPVIMFTSVFLIVVILAWLKLFGMQPYDVRAIYVIEIGTICFVVGAYMIRLILSTSSKITKAVKVINFRWPFIYGLTCLVTFGNVLMFFYSLRFLLHGGTYTQLRDSLLGYEDAGATLVLNPLVDFFYNYLTGPGMYALLPIAIFLIVQREHKKFSLIIFINLLINIIASGSRIPLIYTIIQFMIVMSYEKVQLSKNVKRIIGLLIFVAILTVVILSNARSSSGIFHSFYVYFAGPVVLLSYWMNYVDQLNIHSYGLSFIYPITWLMNAFTNILGDTHIEIIKNVVSWQRLPQDIWVGAFPSQPMNAFSTMFYFFYEDFRYIGVGIFSLIFGGISETVYFQASINKNTKFLLIYLLGVKVLIGAFMTWQLGSTVFFLSLVLLLICVGSKSEDYASQPKLR